MLLLQVREGIGKGTFPANPRRYYRDCLMKIQDACIVGQHFPTVGKTLREYGAVFQTLQSSQEIGTLDAPFSIIGIFSPIRSSSFDSIKVKNFS